MRKASFPRGRFDREICGRWSGHARMLNALALVRAIQTSSVSGPDPDPRCTILASYRSPAARAVSFSRPISTTPKPKNCFRREAQDGKICVEGPGMTTRCRDHQRLVSLLVFSRTICVVLPKAHKTLVALRGADPFYYLPGGVRSTTAPKEVYSLPTMPSRSALVGCRALGGLTRIPRRSSRIHSHLACATVPRRRTQGPEPLETPLRHTEG